MAARRPAAGARAALGRELGRLPEELRWSVEAACAKELARSVDQGLLVVSSSKQLAALMTQLRARARAMRAERPPVTEPVKESPVADIASRIAARRRASTG